MANKNGKITKDGGVRLVSDIYIPLGIARPAVGYSLTHACCNGHGKLRKWARCKPVRSSAVTELSDAERAAADYGFACEPSTSPLDVSVGQWQCLYPREAVAQERKRISDFVGYNHNATAPATPMGNAVFTPFSPEVTFRANTNSLLSRDSVALSDISFLRDCYACVAVTGGALGTSYRWKTAERTVGEGATDVSVSRDEVFGAIADEKRYIHCLATVRKTGMLDSDVRDVLFYPLMADEEMAGSVLWDANPIQYSLVGLLGGTDASAGASLTFRQAALYTGLSSTGTNRYLGMGLSGTLVALVEFSNKTSSAISMDLRLLRARLSPTLAGAQSWSATRPGLQPTAYAVASGATGLAVTAGAAISTVSVPAEGSVRVILALPSIAAMSGGSAQTAMTTDYAVTLLQIQNGSNNFIYDHIRMATGADRDITTDITS